VAIGVWGDPAQCETEAVFDRIRRLAPPPPGAPAPLAISAPGAVEELLTGAGLTLTGNGKADCPFTYPDLDTAWRGQSSAGPLRKAIQIAGEDTVLAAFSEALTPHRRADGTYRQNNVFRYVIATKQA
jgi:hypothetical protein